jgi:hypothetical protein
MCGDARKELKESDLRAVLQVGVFKDENITCTEKACYLRVPDVKRWAQLA